MVVFFLQRHATRIDQDGCQVYGNMKHESIPQNDGVAWSGSRGSLPQIMTPSGIAAMVSYFRASFAAAPDQKKHTKKVRMACVVLRLRMNAKSVQMYQHNLR